MFYICLHIGNIIIIIIIIKIIIIIIIIIIVVDFILEGDAFSKNLSSLWPSLNTNIQTEVTRT